VLRERDADIADLRPADMYSFGMVVYAIATRLQPFADLNPMVTGMKVRPLCCSSGVRRSMDLFHAGANNLWR